MAAAILLSEEPGLADQSIYRTFIKNTSEQIAILRHTYPQLKEFSLDEHVDLDKLKIDYSYHTHDSERTVGWTSAVPNPDPDGIWFYIDLYDKDSIAQIHTQPFRDTAFRFGNKKICFLILQGSDTKSISAEIISIFERNGAKSE